MTDRQTRLVFDKRQTKIAKGLAILFLLFHHVFYPDPDIIKRVSSFFVINDIPIECRLSGYGKICVAIFLFLSGYGLCKSYINSKNSHSIKNDFSFTYKHILKLLSSFWFIYIIFVPLGFVFGRSPVDVYKGNFLYFLFDFLGLSHYFHTPTFNETWWFMNLIIIYYLIFVIIMKLMKWSSEIMLLLGAIVTVFPVFFSFGSEIKTWFFPFVLGVYFSQNNTFDCVVSKNNNFLKRIIICAFMFVFSYLSGIQAFIALSYVLVSFLLLSRIPIINSILEQLGKHSGTIFMFHTFIFDLYFKDFIYWFKYTPIIFLVLTVVCYLIAVGVEKLKKLTRYDKLINKMII